MTPRLIIVLAWKRSVRHILQTCNDLKTTVGMCTETSLQAVLGEKIKEAIHKYYDNSLDNIGAWNSFAW